MQFEGQVLADEADGADGAAIPLLYLPMEL